MADTECPTCGKTGFANTAGMKRHHALAHNESIAGELVECAHCGTETRKRPHEIRDYEYNLCSEGCQREWLHEQNSGSGNPRYQDAKDMYECHWCGENVELWPSVAALSERVFCSDECTSKWRSEYFSGEQSPRWSQIDTECDWCGDSVTKHPSAVQNRKHTFCSKRCASNHHSQMMLGENNPNYTHGVSDSLRYGRNWERVRRRVLERDGYECQRCGISLTDYYGRTGRSFDIHHRTPLSEFDSYESANQLDNLESLCQRCHGIKEHAS